MCRSDVSISATAMQVCTKGSKTNQTRKGTIISIGSTSSSVCPVSAMQKYLQYHSNPNHPSPLFIFGDLTRKVFQSYLQVLLAGLDLQYIIITPHSFRIGAATTATAAGLPDWLIQLLGRWSSNAYQTYIRNPQTPILQAAGIIAGVPYPPNPNKRVFFT